MAIIMDHRSLRVGDVLIPPQAGVAMQVTADNHLKIYTKLMLGLDSIISRQGTQISVIRSNNILEAVAGQISQEAIDNFWQNQGVEDQEWDIYQIEKTLPEKLALMQQMWQQYCDRFEQAEYEARNNL